MNIWSLDQCSVGGEHHMPTVHSLCVVTDRTTDIGMCIPAESCRRNVRPHLAEGRGRLVNQQLARLSDDDLLARLRCITCILDGRSCFTGPQRGRHAIMDCHCNTSSLK